MLGYSFLLYLNLWLIFIQIIWKNVHFHHGIPTCVGNTKGMTDVLHLKWYQPGDGRVGGTEEWQGHKHNKV